MDIINYFNRIRCPKIVKPSKFEYNQASNQVWWSNKFKELEAGIKVPPYRKLSELKKVFNDEELSNLTRAGLEYEDDLIDIKKRGKRPHFKIKRKCFRSMVYIPSRRYSLFKEKQMFADSLIKFCNKRESEVDVWSSKPKWSASSLIPCIKKANKVEEMSAANLKELFNTGEILPTKVDIKTISIQKALTIENKLPQNFEKYLDLIETNDKETFLNLFQITTTLPISKGLSIEIEELVTVPDYVAKYCGIPELGTSCALQREIRRDLITAYLKPKQHAFGAMLPVRLRRFKTSLNPHWINLHKREIKYRNLRTFAAVFEGILHLETSKGFIAWLRNHPGVSPPEYLLNTCFKIKTSKKFFFLRHNFEIAFMSKYPGCSSATENSSNDISVIMV